MDQRMMRAVDAARVLGLHPRTVVRLVKLNELEGARVGGMTLVRTSAVERLIGAPLESVHRNSAVVREDQQPA